ncbi:MAG: hypothetical protein JO006_07755 [Paucibacter sp.]|nr:hypothetical protein [Roseateles sp.]
MHLLRTLAVGLLLATRVTLPVGAAESQPATPPSAAYTPGLGEFMSTIQLRHAKLWFAGKGKNWALAAYELDELKEAFEEVGKYQPAFDGKPIAKLIGPMTAAPIAQLEHAIQAKDMVGFSKGFDALSHACSACHQATEHGFILIQRPVSPPMTNQRYEPARQP